MLDTLGDLTDSVNFALQLYDCPAISEQDTRRFIGNGYAKLIERAIPDGTENPNFSRCVEEFACQYKNNMTNHTKPYPGILDLLSELKRKKYRLAVVSNKNDSAVKSLTKHYFGEYIQIAIGASATIPRKPDPTSVCMALEELVADKNEAIYVGDSDVDIFTARNAGIPCVSVSWGFRDKDFLEKNGANHLIESAFDLLPILEQPL